MSVKDINAGAQDFPICDYLTNVGGTLLQRQRRRERLRALEERRDRGRDRPRQGYSRRGDWLHLPAPHERGGTLYFWANDGVSGYELWKSDGTEAGTVRVKDINAGARPVRSRLPLTNVGGTLYFSADDGTSGCELWKSDGTEAGPSA